MKNIIIFYIVIILLLVTGCIDKNNTDIMYTQEPSTMVLAITDMPDGWHLNENSINGESATSSFGKLAFTTAIVVNCEVTKYPSIDNAKSEYQTMYNTDTSKTSVKNNDIGQESYTKEDYTGLHETTIFRKGNVIIKIECFGTDSVQYAKIVNDKIQH